MKGFYYINYPSFLGHNPKNILTFFLIDFDNDCYYSYNSQKSNFESKLKDNKKDKINDDFDKLILKKVMIINDETFNRLLDTQLFLFKQNYSHNALKALNLEEFLI
jgi:hypothetical protein